MQRLLMMLGLRPGARPEPQEPAEPLPPGNQTPVAANQLFDALSLGDVAEFRNLADRWNGVALEDLRDEFGNSLLHAAADNDDVGEVLPAFRRPHAPEFLNARSALPPALTAVQMAVFRGHVRAVQALREAGAQLHGQGLLATAIHEGDGDMVDYLLNLPDRPGADPRDRDAEGFNALDRAVQAGQVEIVRRLIGPGVTDIRVRGGALYQAAVNHRGQSAMELALAYPDVDRGQQMVDLLIAAGAAMPAARASGAGAARPYGAYRAGAATGPGQAAGADRGGLAR